MFPVVVAAAVAAAGIAVVAAVGAVIRHCRR